jgi:hypothetical protein
MLADLKVEVLLITQYNIHWFDRVVMFRFDIKDIDMG